ncbi:unnamed protein product, partial [marine sediment metagenome]
EFCKNHVLPAWEARKNFQINGIKEYTGHHPKYIQPLIGTYWKR